MNSKLILSILRLSCFLLFFGRAWQHLFWDAPFRALFWDEGLMEGFITGLLGISWQEYATSPTTDSNIQLLIRLFGLFYLTMAVLVLFIQEKHKFGKPLLWISAVCLSFLAFLYCKEKFFHIGQFFEYASQVLCPILLSFALYNKTFFTSNGFIRLAKIAVALTFIAHGMYAIGYYPRPGVFVDMTISSLGVSEDTAHIILRIAGILDFVAGIGLFWKNNSFYFIFYCVIWGFLTAFARTWANVQMGPLFFDLLHQYLPQTIYRMPHALLPLIVLILDYPSLKLFQRFEGNTKQLEMV